jgi:hypothetical protein
MRLGRETDAQDVRRRAPRAAGSLAGMGKYDGESVQDAVPPFNRTSTKLGRA